MARFGNEDGTWLVLGAVLAMSGAGFLRSGAGSKAIDLDAILDRMLTEPQPDPGVSGAPAKKKAPAKKRAAKKKVAASQGQSGWAFDPFSPSEGLQVDIDALRADVSRAVAQNKGWRDERPLQEADAQRALDQARFQDYKQIHAQIRALDQRRWNQKDEDEGSLWNRKHKLWNRLLDELVDSIDALPPRMRKEEAKILDKSNRKTPHNLRYHELTVELDNAIKQLEQS